MHLRSLTAAGLLAGCLAAALVLPLQAKAAEPIGQLDLPSFSHLQSKATEVVDVTLGSWPLALASKFMNADDPEDAEVKKLISGIKSIAVRSYEFDSDFVYSKEDVDAVRSSSRPGLDATRADPQARQGPGRRGVRRARRRPRQGLCGRRQRAAQVHDPQFVGSIDLDQLAKLSAMWTCTSTWMTHWRDASDMSPDAARAANAAT